MTDAALRAGSWILNELTRLMPITRRHWGDALMAESQAVPEPERLRFLVGAISGVLQVTARHHIERAWSERHLVAAALICGLIVGWVDAASMTRHPLRILLLLTCIAAGVVRPAGSWRWGALIGIGVAASAGLDPAGPYVYDTGDKWFPLLPAIMLAGSAGWLKKGFVRG
jgi:hypothetical protein